MRKREAGRVDWDQIYRENAPFLRGVGYRVCGDVSVAEDLLQEVFLRALEQSTSSPPARDELLAILSKLAVAALESRRSLNYAGSWLPMPVQTDLGSSEAGREQETLGFDSLCVLEELEPEARAVFVLAEFAGQALASIGASFAQPLEAVEISLVETRLRLEQAGLYRMCRDGYLEKKVIIENLGKAFTAGEFTFPREGVASRVEIAFDHGGTCNAPDNQFCTPGAAAKLLQGLLTHGNSPPQIAMAELNFLPGLLAEIGDGPEGEAERLAVLFGWDRAGVLSRIRVVLAPTKLRAVSFDGLRPSLGELI